MQDKKFISENYRDLYKISEKFRNEYKSASPFPHIFFDNFFESKIIKEIANNFPNLENAKDYFDPYLNKQIKRISDDKIVVQNQYKWI